jgi:diguanylate cyclase (GGDEF)-like protein/PAS domain S-box-containing protein
VGFGSQPPKQDAPGAQRSVGRVKPGSYPHQGCYRRQYLTEVLGNTGNGAFDIVWLPSISEGLQQVRLGGIDAIVVDLKLRDSTGIDTFDQLFAIAPHTPIMTLSTGKDEPLALEAIRRGAQGCLAKGHLASYLVPQTVRSVIQRKAVEDALYKEKARAEIALNSISDAVICTDMSGRIDYLNIAAENMTGWSREEARGLPIAEVFRSINGVTRKPPERHPVELVLLRDEPMGLAADTVLARRDGSEAAIEDSASPIHDWNSKLTSVVIVFHDVSAAQAMTMKMAHLAQHDFLTNLPNRVLLSDRLSQAIISAKRRGMQLAVLFLDLDNFKHINDSLGHATGDKLLQSVARRLTGCVRSSDTVSRQGGDEFVILLEDGKYGEDAALTANKLLAVLALPHSIDERELHITTSIGISTYPADGQNAEVLIKNADTAMYHAKEKGRNNYQFFRPDMNVRAVERQLIEAGLRKALEKHEFILHYQPKVNLQTGRITGAEALLRWSHPEWAWSPPIKVRGDRRVRLDCPDRSLGAARSVHAGKAMDGRRTCTGADRR